MYSNFTTFEKKGPRPKWTMYKHVSDKSKKFLFVVNTEILSVVIVVTCIPAPAYTSLRRELEYLPKS